VNRRSFFQRNGMGQNPKSEARKPKEIRGPKSETAGRRCGWDSRAPLTRHCFGQHARIRLALPKDSVFGFRASFGFRFSVFGFIWSRHCIGNVEEPENDIPAMDAGPTLRSVQRASNWARYSVGDWPSSFLKTRLKCVSDWNPTSNAISLTRRLGFSSRFFAFSMRTRER